MLIVIPLVLLLVVVVVGVRTRILVLALALVRNNWLLLGIIACQSIKFIEALERIGLGPQFALFLHWRLVFLVGILRLEAMRITYSVAVTVSMAMLELLLEQLFVLLFELVHFVDELHHVDLSIPLVNIIEIDVAKFGRLLLELPPLVDVGVPLGQIEQL